jgi:hypothetical protein
MPFFIISVFNLFLLIFELHIFYRFLKMFFLKSYVPPYTLAGFDLTTHVSVSSVACGDDTPRPRHQVALS